MQVVGYLRPNACLPPRLPAQVEDIVDSGLTLSSVVKILKSTGGAQSVKV